MSFIHRGRKLTHIDISDVEIGDKVSRGIFAAPRKVVRVEVARSIGAGTVYSILTLEGGVYVTGQLGDTVLLWQ